jgi:hypothetical protein
MKDRFDDRPSELQDDYEVGTRLLTMTLKLCRAQRTMSAGTVQRVSTS